MAWNTKDEFKAAVPFDKYELAHGWARWVSEDFATKSAWELYEKAKVPLLGFILLGETKLRKDPTLVYAFGLMTAGGIQEPESVEMIKELEKKGKEEQTGPPNIGTGSILSDQNWTPLLNDSLILGGVHRGKEFHFTDERLSGYDFAKPKVPKGVAAIRASYENKGADLSNRPKEVQVWRDFFRDHQSVLWDSTAKISRILARELIGLMTFNYEAVLSAHQLSFLPRRGGGGSPRANFSQYLQALRHAGYFTNDEKALLGGISKFLFGRSDAI